MATQICPTCKQDSFTWSIDEEESPLTFWGCDCGYNAYEDESRERVCEVCTIKTESHMRDDQKEFWWCSSCNKIEIIKTVPNNGYKA